jgi:single-strand DNA-binding protein
MFNSVQLLGFVGQDPEFKSTPNGNTSLVNFSLGTQEGKKDANGKWMNETQWHKCVAFGDVADSLKEKVKKGTTLFVAGSIRYVEYTNKEGEKRYLTSIVCGKIKIVDKVDNFGSNRGF